MRLRLALTLLVVLMGTLLPARVAEAARRVEWTGIEVRPGDDARRVAETLRGLLKQATRKAKWGKGDRLDLSARVTALSWEERDDVVRLSVTVVAQVGHGQTARSHIRVGGRPSERRKLERQALSIVASGLVTRLSEIARSR